MFLELSSHDLRMPVPPLHAADIRAEHLLLMMGGLMDWRSAPKAYIRKTLRRILPAVVLDVVGGDVDELCDLLIAVSLPLIVSDQFFFILSHSYHHVLSGCNGHGKAVLTKTGKKRKPSTEKIRRGHEKVFS